jgi:hypothetical protein
MPPDNFVGAAQPQELGTSLDLCPGLADRLSLRGMSHARLSEREFCKAVALLRGLSLAMHDMIESLRVLGD